MLFVCVPFSLGGLLFCTSSKQRMYQTITQHTHTHIRTQARVCAHSAVAGRTVLAGVALRVRSTNAAMWL